MTSDKRRCIELASLFAVATVLLGLLLHIGSSEQTAPLQPQPSYETSEQTEKQTKWHITIWEWLAPDSISFYTLGLLVFSGVLALVSYGHLKALQRENAASQKVADAANTSALVAKDTLTKTFRPRLRVRKVRKEEFTVPKEKGQQILIRISLSLANVGDADAFVPEINGGLHWISHGHPLIFPQCGPDATPVPTLDMPPGTAQELVIETTEYGYRFVDSRAKNEDLYFWGFVRYMDDSHRTRETGFCRRYDPNTRGFIRVENPDFEYED